MAFNCVVLCWFILQLSKISLGSYVSPKIIKDSEDVIINVGESYNLTCQGSEPITWIYPKVKGTKEKWTTFQNISSEVPQNDNYIYRSVLHITNMSYPFVGYYTCLYENKPDGDRDQIYLYVNDPEHLYVEDVDKVHYAIQYQETTLPCRPTHPDIQVDLISYSNDLVFTPPFNPRTGFLLNSTNEKFDAVYTCIFTSEGITIHKTVVMDVERRLETFNCEK